MSIKFITKEEPERKTLRLLDVMVDQFFITNGGYLAQKCSESSYNLIANSQGVPFASSHQYQAETTVIAKILPEVAKIEF
jgi:hypothetical protein